VRKRGTFSNDGKRFQKVVCVGNRGDIESNEPGIDESVHLKRNLVQIKDIE
jgi:hypothetical protein